MTDVTEAMTKDLQQMSWPAVQHHLKETTLVVVPTASIEQHGPHLPLSVDSIRARELGQRIAVELDCFLAPVVRPGLSEHHMAFPGTITLSESTFKAVIDDYCTSLSQHGFTEIALFTSHGGNTTALNEVVRRINNRLSTQVFVAGTRDGMMDARTTAMKLFDVTPHEAGAHAGAAETAFLMEIAPELVQDLTGTTGFIGELPKDAIDEGIDAVSEKGVLGDPEKASSEQGEHLIESCAQYLASEIRSSADSIENP